MHRKFDGLHNIRLQALNNFRASVTAMIRTVPCRHEMNGDTSITAIPHEKDSFSWKKRKVIFSFDVESGEVMVDFAIFAKNTQLKGVVSSYQRFVYDNFFEEVGLTELTRLFGEYIREGQDALLEIIYV